MAKKPPPDRHRDTATGTGELLTRARDGDQSAINSLFRRQGEVLRRWARGRLPRWARSVSDTADVVQEALLNTFRGIERFEDRGPHALQAFLRRVALNRILDEMRKVARRPVTVEESPIEPVGPDPSPFDLVLETEREQLYKDALAELNEDEQILVVARLELDYTYEQLAAATGRPGPEAARQAVRRAVLKLVDRMRGV